jgi:hypothetical protein
MTGELRWASASDQQSQLVEEEQERLGIGPCRAAFSQRMAITVRNAGTSPIPMVPGWSFARLGSRPG